MIRRYRPKDSENQELVDLAQRYAGSMICDAGTVPPALLADTDDEIILFRPESMGDERAKQNFANNTRLIAVAYRVTAVSFVMESCARFTRPGRPLDSTPLSQSPDPAGCGVISVEIRHQQATKLLMIFRDGTRVFAGFTPPSILEVGGFRCGFAQIMPPKPHGNKNITLEKQLLQLIGFDAENHGFNPMWN